METRRAIVSILVPCMLATTLIWTLPTLAEEVPEFDLATAVGLWLLDEGEGEVASDTSGNGNDGDLMGRPGPEWVDGRFGKALRFNGENNFVWVRQAPGLPLEAAPRTLMCFFKWDLVDWPVIDGLSPFGYGPVQFNQRVEIYLDAAQGLGTETCYDRKMFSWEGDTEWHHVAAVLPEFADQTTSFLIYFDGELREDAFVAEESHGIETVVGPLTIGCQPGTNSMYFNGIVDDVAVFPSALPEEHIRSIARAGLVGARAVSPSGKLATSWGTLKTR